MPVQNRASYKVNIVKSIKTQVDLTNLIASIVAGYCSWREGLYFDVLRRKGWTLEEIGKITGRSKAHMSLFSKKLYLAGSENKQAPADKRANACLSSLSTKKTSAVERTVAGQTTAVVGQVDRVGSQSSFERSESDDFIGSAQKQ